MQCRRARLWIGGCLVLLSALVGGCGGYGDISPTAYEYAKALYSITNRRADGKLNEVAAQIEATRVAGKLSDAEAGWLTDIVNDSRSGKWEAANSAARRMMEDQAH
ncbi:MAG: hypothetical protein WD845_02460 [Pirellulales bacterium]